jgi:bifunctional non-homologous end joining protein LigD
MSMTSKSGPAKPSAAPKRLGEYRAKRSFEATPEPEPGPEPEFESGSAESEAKPESESAESEAHSTAKPKSGDAPGSSTAADARFVVHEHHATRLHWDLRLEHDGALASWAVPNGIPLDPKHNRKAIHVEDHPLSYIDFAGTIPSGNYGAGEVTVWDRGTYACEKWEPRKLIVVFHGERLRGRYALFQAGHEERDWLIHRMDAPADPTAQEMPEFVAPMLASLSRLPAEESQWAFEVKWDGVRAIAHSQPGRLKLLSRNGNEVTGAYPELRALNRALSSHEALIDGEIIAFDTHGRPSFEALQPRMHQRGQAAIRRLMRSTPVTYVAFDLLWLDGHSLMDRPYAERRTRLQELDLDGEHWRTPGYHHGEGEGRALLEATRARGLEGVVAKRLDSLYTPAGRTGAWLKIKHHRRQEAVIGGWSEGKGERAGRIGALDLGVYDEHAALRYAGQVGTGFDEPELARLAGMLSALAIDDSPFTGRQPPRGTHYVQPDLVCEVEFSEWTTAGRLRQASYRGLREDKPAAEVLRERVTVPEDIPAPASSTGAQPEGPAPLATGRRVRGGLEVEIEGRTLRLTNLEKILYPETGFTKGDLIGYYAAVAPALLPHLHDRPLTLKRYPNGVQGEHFYEKQSPDHRPEWVQTARIWSEHSKREIDYTLCQDLPTLVWLANLAALELHPSLSLAGAQQSPTALVFDLDPGAPAGVLECCEVALELCEMFEQLGLSAFAKTSGSKGLQVYIPLNDDRMTYEQTKPFAHAVANLLAQRRPELVRAEMARAERTGRVLIDWSQNDEHKTTISVYSPRALTRPTVSTPVTWGEVRSAREQHDPQQLVFETAQVLERVAERDDLFAEVVSLHQTLPDLGG